MLALQTGIPRAANDQEMKCTSEQWSEDFGEKVESKSDNEEPRDRFSSLVADLVP